MTGPIWFTVVVPTFHRPGKLARCLEGLAEQTLSKSAFEVIVVDDSGRRDAADGEALVAHGINGTWLHQEHSGPAAARNLGASKAQGRYLAFIDDDCRPASDWLETVLGHFQRTTDEPLIGGRVINALPDDVFASASQALVDYLSTYFNANGHQAMLLTSNNLCVPAASFRQLGGFDTAFKDAGGEDRELCLRWVGSGRRSVYAPDAVVLHSHDMTLLKFIRQHRAYGLGAAVLRRRLLDQGYGPVPLEPLSFYIDLLRYPMTSSGRGASWTQTALFALSQAANSVGFFHVRLMDGIPIFRTRGR